MSAQRASARLEYQPPNSFGGQGRGPRSPRMNSRAETENTLKRVGMSWDERPTCFSTFGVSAAEFIRRTGARPKIPANEFAD